MSSLQYFSYEKVGKELEEKHGFCAAVRIGDRIECSGQGKSHHILSSDMPF